MHPKKFKGNPDQSRLINPEKVVAKYLLGDFKPKGSRGETLIREIFKQKVEKISQPALISAAELISLMIGVKLTRNEKRLKSLVIKWFNDNASLIEQFKNYIIVDFVDQDEKREKNRNFFNINDWSSGFQTDSFDYE